VLVYSAKNDRYVRIPEADLAEQLVAQLVSENVAGTVHTGHMLSNKLRHIFHTFSFNQSENGIPNDVIFCSLLLLGCRLSSEQNMTSLGIPFSDW